MTPRRKSPHWSLDKKVPLALILTIGIQTAGIVWWGGALSERVNALERKAEIVAPQGERLARVETKVEAIQAGVGEIKAILQLPAAAKPR